MNLADVTGSLRRHWRLSVAMVLLSILGLGLFLFTRKQVRGDDRWQSSVLLLVPTRGKDGTLPAGVPPELLQGQAQMALAPETVAGALDGARITGSDRRDVTFGFKTNFDPSAVANKTGNQSTGRGDILTLTVSAPDRTTAVTLVQSYADVYKQQRSKKVKQDEQGGTLSARRTIEILKDRLAEVDTSLGSLDPVLLSQLRGNDSTNGTDQTGAPINIAPEAPTETVLLAYEHRYLVDRILGARQTYAENTTAALTPSSYANIVEQPNPVQIIPALPSPWVPVGVALGLGLLLAVGVPVLIDVLDRTIREPRSAMRALGAPVLTTLPIESGADLAHLAVPGSTLDAAYRALATTSVATDQLPRAIVVTSPVGDAQDGVAANFAAALAELGLEVALIATQARQGWFVDATSAVGSPTLTDMLAVTQAGSRNGQVRERLIPSHLSNLTVVAPSEVDSDDLLEGLPRLFEGLASAGVDVTVIAGPALLEDPAATIYAWSTRSVLWVIEAGEVTELEAREANSRLELAGGAPFGIAMITEAS